jgi:hypothetical protein
VNRFRDQEVEDKRPRARPRKVEMDVINNNNNIKNNNTWDVKIADTSVTVGAAAEASAERKTSKYGVLTHHYSFVPIAIETFGPVCAESQSVIRDIGKRVSAALSDPREAVLLFQRMSVAAQRYIAICFASIFQSATDASHT